MFKLFVNVFIFEKSKQNTKKKNFNKQNKMSLIFVNAFVLKIENKIDIKKNMLTKGTTIFKNHNFTLKNFKNDDPKIIVMVLD